MTTDAKDTALETQAPSAATQDAPAPGTPETINWEAKAKEYEAATKKLEGDLKSLTGRYRNLDDLKGAIGEVRDEFANRFGGMKDVLLAMAKAQHDGDMAPVEAAVHNIQEQENTGRAQQAFIRTNNRLLGTFEPLLDWQTEPELKAIYRNWSDAYKKMDYDGAADALNRMTDIVSRAKQQRGKAAIEADKKRIKDEADAAAKRAKADAGVMDTGVGGTPAGRGKPDINSIDPTTMTPRQMLNILAEASKKG